MEGVNWDGNGNKFVLQAYPTQQFLDVEEKLRGRHYDRIDFNFCIIVDELTEEELDELLSLVEIYGKVPKSRGALRLPYFVDNLMSFDS